MRRDPPWNLLPIEQLLQHPVAARYILGWGRPGDSAVIAQASDRRIGAAWYRRFFVEELEHGFVRSEIPSSPSRSTQTGAVAVSVGRFSRR
jgi:hypothetical protein